MGHKDYSLAEGGSSPKAMIMPVGKPAMLTPSSNTTPHEVVVSRMPVSKIPGAMRKMGWNVSAALMDRWFASPEWTMTPDLKSDKTARPATSLSVEHVDERIVTMEWALNFDRCARALRVLQERWGVPAAADELLAKLRNRGWNGRSRLALGGRQMSARQLEDTCCINYREVGDPKDTLDDFYGALGVATLKLAIVGTAITFEDTGKRGFYVSALGFYLKDHYDFNGHQYLGMWTEEGVAGKARTLLAGVLRAESPLLPHDAIYDWQASSVGHVYNESFQNYREHHHRGGDFFIYSDVHWKDVDYYVDLGDALERESQPYVG